MGDGSLGSASKFDRAPSTSGVSWRDKDRNARLLENQMSNQTSMRGQDITARDSANSIAASRDANQLNNNTSLANARGLRELDWRRFNVGQNNWEKDYALNSDKYSHQQDQDVLSNQQTADKALHDSQLKSLPTIRGKDGTQVGDEDKANAAVAGAHAMIQARAQALLNSDDGRGVNGVKAAADAQARAKNTLQQGTASLSEGDRDFLPKGMEVMNRFNTLQRNLTNNMGGRGAIGPQSDNPEDFRINGAPDSNGRVTLGDPKYGRSMHINDLSRTSLENPILPDINYLNPRTSELIGNTVRSTKNSQ